MCGIFGYFNLLGNAVNPDFLEPMARRLAHRGPDGHGTYHTKQLAFGAGRLAIIDLSDAGAQPMAGAGGRLWLTFNGEIYNYLELMAELAERGHVFQSHSDTEVILKAYEEWGPDCLARFNGMFAFAIWDTERCELFAARDRFGEKPFHYSWLPEENWFAFGSEVKSLLPWPEVDGALDDRALYRFLAFEELAGAEQTLWRGVRRLPHAHWLRLKWTGSQFDLTVKRYWDIDLTQTSDMSLAEAARRLRETFADSIKLGETSVLPFHFSWPMPGPGPHAMIARMTDNRGAPMDSVPLIINVVRQGFTSNLIASNSVWKYLDNGSNQGTNWSQPAFSDVAWPAGPHVWGMAETERRRRLVSVATQTPNTSPLISAKPSRFPQAASIRTSCASWRWTMERCFTSTGANSTAKTWRRAS